MFTKSDFFGYEQYTLSSDTLEFSVLSLGGAITALRYRGEDTVLHFENAEGYEKGYCFLNFLIGRYANRIKNARVTISGKEYQLDQNERGNQLHGGKDGFHKKIWTLLESSENSFALGYTSPDGECGYPGELKVKVIYCLDGDAVNIRFLGECDQDTIFAPTYHTYFSLTNNCLDTKLLMNCSSYLTVDEQLIPKEQVPVDDKFDFRFLRPIGQNYDHAFVADGKAFALMVGDNTAMFFRSDFPAMQLYTGSFMGPAFEKNAGVALECEFFPDSPNRTDCESPVLKAGKVFDRFVEYRFCPAEEILK